MRTGFFAVLATLALTVLASPAATPTNAAGSPYCLENCKACDPQPVGDIRTNCFSSVQVYACGGTSCSAYGFKNTE